jgi:prepilin-type N-terminal cleavage/methylation domain-containing protein
MKMNLKKGFTLIELLVVVAIIGILASVVLASLNSARAKGADAAVKANLANIRAQAELIYDNANGSYAAVCADATVTSALNAASQAGAGNTTSDVCNNIAASWSAAAPLKSTNVFGAASGTDYWCVDSTGKSAVQDAALAAGATNLCS